MSAALIPALALAIPGTLAIRRLDAAAHPAARLGLGILLGIGGGTTLAAAAGMLGMPLAAPAVFGLLAAASLVTIGVAVMRRPAKPPPGPADSAGWAPAEILLLSAILALLVFSAVRAGFYPVSAMDAHSYDGRARWIVEEKTLRLSIYGELGVGPGSNLTYPPLYPLSLALGYWTGAPQGKEIDSLFFAALLLVVFGEVRRAGPRLSALAATFLVCAAPELWQHGSLALTNLPAAAFMAAGILPLLRAGEAPAAAPRPALTGLFLAFAAGTRTDHAVLAAAAAGVLAFVAWRRGDRAGRAAARLALQLSPAVLLTLAWQLFVAPLVAGGRGPFRASLLPDPALLGRVLTVFARLLLTPGLYGWVVYLFLAACAAVLILRAGGRTAGPFASGVAVVAALSIALVLLFQQIDPAFGGGDASYLRNSLKRDLFDLLPVMAVTACAAPPVARGLAAVDRWQRGG